MTEPVLDIVYYVHHHGDDHIGRYRSILAASPDHLHPFTELDLDLGPTGLRLPPDCAPGRDVRDPTAHGALRWAPLAPESLTPRLARIGEWIEAVRPAGAVIDGSVEAALICRLAGLPTIVLRDDAQALDDAQTLALRIASVLLAPWPAQVENPRTPPWILDKTDHVGFIGPPPASGGTPLPESIAGRDDIVVVWGSGNGTAPPLHALHDLRRAARGSLHLVGHCFDGLDVAPDVRAHGWMERVDSLVAAAPVVVTSGAQNAVTSAAIHGCPLIVVPPSRSHDQQIEIARRLDGLGAAIVVDRPDAVDWENVVAAARRRVDRLDEIVRGDGARRAAATIHRRLR